MKIGLRTPSIKKSIKARTTGKIKRAIKKEVTPFYGKKGVGLIKDPNKSIYNKVYKKTTFGVSDVVNTSKAKNHYPGKEERIITDNQPIRKNHPVERSYFHSGIFRILIVIALIAFISGHMVIGVGVLICILFFWLTSSQDKEEDNGDDLTQ